jgi:hypothetical protein
MLKNDKMLSDDFFKQNKEIIDIRRGKNYPMAASKYYACGLFAFIFLVTLSFPQLHAAEFDAPKSSHPDAEGGTRRAIFLSTPFPRIAPSHAIYQSLYTEIFGRMGYDFQIAYYPDVRGLIETNANRTDGSTGRIYDIDLQNNIRGLINRC